MTPDEHLERLIRGNPRGLTPTTPDPRVGLPLTEVVKLSHLRAAVILSDPNAVGLPEDELEDLTRRRFGTLYVTAVSYSPKKRSYQIAVKGPRGGHTMHLKEDQVLP
jgi:hypothetical protein